MTIDLGDLGPVAKPMPDGRIAMLCQGCGAAIAISRKNFNVGMAWRVDGHPVVFACVECSAEAQKNARSVTRMDP